MSNKLYSFGNKYEALTDEEIISKIKLGDANAQNYLLEKYSDLVNIKANKFFLIGAEDDDMFQEGMIGLLEAAKQFDESRGIIGDDSFKKFATTCIKRQILDAIKHANTKKNQPLNNSVPIVRKNEEDDEFEIATFSNVDSLEKITFYVWLSAFASGELEGAKISFTIEFITL